MSDGVNNKEIKIGNGTFSIDNKGVQRDAFKNAKQKSIFDKFDKDKNGILDENEIKSLKDSITEYAGKWDKSSLGKREAARFFKENGIEVSGEKMSREDLNEFLTVMGNNDANQVESAQYEASGNIKVTYKKEGETQKTEWYVKAENSEQSVLFISKEENKKDQTTKTTVYNENGNKSREEENDKKAGATLTTLYSDECNEDGTQKIDKRTRTTKTNLQGGLIEQTEETLDPEHEDRVTCKERKTVNQNPGVFGQITLQDKTTYKYDENGKVAEEKVEQGDKEVTTEFKDGKKTKSTTKSTTKSNNENKTIVENYDENGNVSKKETTITKEDSVTTITEEGNVKTTVLNSKDGKEIQKKTETTDDNGNVKTTVKKDGNEYSAEYDKNGNTTGVIVQNGESPEMIARKFGVKTEDLKEANKSKLKGGGKYFLVGEEIVIPGKVTPEKFNRINSGRASKADSIANYNAYIEEQKAIKEAEKQAQAEQQQQAQAQQKTKIIKANKQKGKALANEVHSAIARVGTDTDKLTKAINSMNNDNVAYVIKEYHSNYFSKDNEGIAEAIWDEKNLYFRGSGVRENYIKQIKTKLFNKAKSLGIDVSNYEKDFEEYLGNNKGELDRILMAVSSAIIAKEGVSASVKKQVKNMNFSSQKAMNCK